MADKINDNTEEEFPGYPHYPAKDDIMNQKDVDRVEADLDDLSRADLTSSALPDKSVKRRRQMISALLLVIWMMTILQEEQALMLMLRRMT